MRLLFLFRAVTLLLLTATGACVQVSHPVAVAKQDPRSIVVGKHWVDMGHYVACESREAEFVVDVFYDVPGVISTTEHFPFRRDWQEVVDYADPGYVPPDDIESVLTVAIPGVVCRDGFDGSWCDGNPDVVPGNDGLTVSMDLAWGQHGSGRMEELKREFLVPWSVLEKTVKDKRGQIRVTVHWRKNTRHPSSHHRG